MTPQEIEKLFLETIHSKKGLSSKIEGFTKNVIYNWKTGRTIAPLSDQLSVLYQLKIIKVAKNE